MSLEHLAHQVSEHPILAPIMWIIALALHTNGMLLGNIVKISPDVLILTQWISFVLASLVSLCVIIGYGYKLYKWLKNG